VPHDGLEPGDDLARRAYTGFRDRATVSANLTPISPSDTPPKNLASCLALLARQSPDLALVAERRESLPEAVRAGIVAMVRAAHPPVARDAP
jgi:hypothetical protein